MANKINWGVALGVIALLVIAASYAYTAFGTQQTVITGEDGKPIVTDTGCSIAPSITVSMLDALAQDTSVTVGTAYRVNDRYIGSTYSAPAKGDKVEVLVNASNYIDTVLPKFTVICGPNNVRGDIYATAAPTLTILDKNLNTLTDDADGGAANLSAIGSGSSSSAVLRVKGTDKKSTSDLIFVVELSSVQNVSDVIVYDASGNKLAKADTPDFYSNTLTSPYVKAFKIPAKLNGVESEYQISIAAKSDKTVSGAVYTTVYGAQAFVEKDGSFVASGIENQNGDTKYEFTGDYDFFINA